MENAIGSLVAQLCMQFPYPEELLTSYRNSLTTGKTRRPSWDSLRDALKWFSKGRKIFLCVDALDEGNNREKMVKFLCELQKTQHDINILVTGREEADLEDAFRLYPRLRMGTYRQEVERDIQAYIEGRLATDSNLRKFSIAVKEEIRVSLIEKSAGMFRWAQCQLDAISRLRTVRSVRMNLDKLPKTLNETYANILRRVDGEDVELLRRILLWTTLAVMPLTLEELHEAIAVEAGISTLDEIIECRLNDPKDVLSLGSSLLSVSETGHVTLAHMSVKDYLLSPDIKATPDVSVFAIDEKDGNRELAMNCITYLSLDSLGSGPAETQEEWTNRLANQPLLKHVAKGWTYYLRAAETTNDLNGVVSDFFTTNSSTFMSWIQILNSNWIFGWDKYPRHATPLYYAASFGLTFVVEDLKRKKIDLNAPGSRFGGTALHGATLRNHVPIVKSLLEAGADPSRADFNKVTPLHTAAKNGNAEVIDLLLKFGASKTAVDSLGFTPYDWAVEAGKTVSQKVLRGEKCEDLDPRLEAPQRIVYQRAPASFPALMVAQGLPIPSLMASS